MGMKQIEEAKPKIMEQLKQMKEVIIGDQIAESTSAAEVYGFSDLWNKVKDAASKLKGATKAKVQEIINKYKPKIIKGLNNVKQVIISEGKRIVITIRNEIVKIITDAEVA